MSEARERYAPYIAGLVEHEKMRRRARRERAARVMEAAQRAAQLLRERYGVTRAEVKDDVYKA